MPSDNFCLENLEDVPHPPGGSCDERGCRFHLSGGGLGRMAADRPTASLDLCVALLSISIARGSSMVYLPPGSESQPPPLLTHLHVWATHAQNFLGFLGIKEPFERDSGFSAIKVCGNFSNEFNKIKEMWLYWFPKLVKYYILG